MYLLYFVLAHFEFPDFHVAFCFFVVCFGLFVFLIWCNVGKGAQLSMPHSLPSPFFMTWEISVIDLLNIVGEITILSISICPSFRDHETVRECFCFLIRAEDHQNKRLNN